jgi:single-strand DNA-binding protein
MINKKSINRVILVGHVGSQPETRFSKEGSCFSSFSLATHEIRKIKNKEEEHTEWHNVLAIGKLGEFADKYIKKGQLVSVEGRLRTNKWLSKDGVKRNMTEIVATSLVPLDWKE